MFVIREPILTEKSFAKIKDRVYVFKVERGATKARIKNEVEFIFNVKVKRVNTLADPLRRRRVGRSTGFRPHFKRAILYLEEGYSISIYPEGENPDLASVKTEAGEASPARAAKPREARGVEIESSEVDTTVTKAVTNTDNTATTPEGGASGANLVSPEPGLDGEEV